MTKRKKREYVDRFETLSSSSKRPNFCLGLRAQDISINENKSLRKFSYKLSMDDDNYLIAYVLPNSICVLFVPPSIEAVSVVYNVDTPGVSGKKKRGAYILKAGSKFMTLTNTEGSQIELVTPIGGQLLELNESLLVSPVLLSNRELSVGYAGVLLPDTSLPTPGNDHYWELLQKGLAKSPGTCFAYQKGCCRRGSSCRFSHVSVDCINSDLLIENRDSEH